MNGLDKVVDIIKEEANKRNIDPVELLDRVHEIMRDKEREYYY